MSLSDKARELAGKIDKATPGEWKIAKCEGDACISMGSHQRNRYNYYSAHLINGYPDFVYKEKEAKTNLTAICLARNEAPALLRQLADENERLRRVVDQAIKIGFIRIDDFRVCVTGGSACVVEIKRLAPELVQELQQRVVQP